MRIRILALFVVIGVAGCWDTTNGPSQVPEECKVTTNPDACRKAYQHH